VAGGRASADLSSRMDGLAGPAAVDVVVEALPVRRNAGDVGRRPGGSIALPRTRGPGMLEPLPTGVGEALIVRLALIWGVVADLRKPRRVVVAVAPVHQRRRILGIIGPEADRAAQAVVGLRNPDPLWAGDSHRQFRLSH